MRGLTPSLVNRNDPTHRAALAVYSWRTLEWALATAAAPWAERVVQQADADLLAVQRRRGLAPIGAHATEWEIRAAADVRADECARRIDTLSAPMGSEAMRAWLVELVESMEARPGAAFAFVRSAGEPGAQLRAMLARARCALWWRRQLRRAVVRACEAEAQAAGRVHRRSGQVYLTDETLTRYRRRLESSRGMMEGTRLESEAGHVMTLAELSAVSVSNPAIRRGELMTRIRGCERWADAMRHPGLFLTLTCPSRFHARRFDGQANPKWQGATPRDGQRWLSMTWARARAALQRAGVKVYGLRVAEPHHDGCPHWHALLWVDGATVDGLVSVLRRYWLADEGDEPGAQRHRVKALPMAPGGAAGYVAKYIAKGIDDAGAVGLEGHRDDGGEGDDVDLFGGHHQRVTAWASAWGIRQFQAIGQPPVTVWRELRRVPEAARVGGSWALHHAAAAADRKGERRADWCEYMLAQGGPCTGRRYQVRIARELRERVGRYATGLRLVPIGVHDAAAPARCWRSARLEWRRAGEWGARSAPAVPPRTRDNNCTVAPSGRPAVMLAGRLLPAGSRLRTWREAIAAPPPDHGTTL